jgi:transketolase
MSQDNLKDRWSSFGWHVIQAEGNDTGDLNRAFDEARSVKGKPTVIIANTTKGYGSSVMENKAGWHHHLPSEEEYSQIIADLKAGMEAAIRE